MKNICYNTTILFVLILYTSVNLFAQNPKAFLDSALVKSSEGDYRSAIQFCDQAIQQNDTLKLAYFYRAGFYTALISKQNAMEDYQNYKSAIADYSKVIVLDNTNAEAFFYRGGVHSEMGFLEQAVNDYLTSVSINEKQPEVYNSLAVCKARLGNPQEALQYINIALELDNGYAKAYSNKGNIHDMLNQPKKACKNWKKAIELGYQGNMARYNTHCKE